MRLTNTQLAEAIELRRAGTTYTDLATRYGVHPRTLQHRVEQAIGRVDCAPGCGKADERTLEMVAWLRENAHTHTFDEACRVLVCTKKKLWYLEERYDIRCKRLDQRVRKPPARTVWGLDGFNELAGRFIRGDFA